MPLEPAPKDPLENAAYRRALLEACADDVELQHEIWMRCARDPCWFVSTWLWTFSPKDFPDNPVRPFILYDYQETAVRDISRAITTKQERLVEKSRDMGASWICLAVFFHRWLFFSNQSFLLGSRKQEYVDKRGDLKALLPKIDFLIRFLPDFLQPSGIERVENHILNLDNSSVIDGESTNANFATGDRRTGVLLDEFSKVDQGWSIISSAVSVSDCVIFNSTPCGASGAYYEKRQKLEATRPHWIIRFHWSLHPEKKRGLYSTVDGKEGSAIRIIDTDYEFEDGYPFIRDGKLRSPWYDEQCLRAPSQHIIAQELDIDYRASGGPFFDGPVMQKIMDQYARDPLLRGELNFDPDGKHPEFVPTPNGRLELWLPLNERLRVPDGHEYVAGNDLSTGKGGDMTSNSACSIVDKFTGEKVAQFTTNSLYPEQFCVYVVALCRFFHDAYLIWEDNGPGGQFTSRLKELHYGNIYHREEGDAIDRAKKTRKLGWHTGKENKRVLLGDYFAALMNGKFVNRCRQALQECLEYAVQPNGTIEHSKALVTIDPLAAGENHGDMVIADALANRALGDVARIEDLRPSAPPANSILGRRLAAQKAKEKIVVY